MAIPPAANLQIRKRQRAAKRVAKVTLIDSHDDGQPLQPGSLLQQVVRSRDFLDAVRGITILVIRQRPIDRKGLAHLGVSVKLLLGQGASLPDLRVERSDVLDGPVIRDPNARQRPRLTRYRPIL